MKPIPQDEYQRILLNCLKAFQDYCDHYGIDMFLGGGSALGAVRHKGFIPWDDDIDTYIFRKDYNKLLALAEKNPYIDTEKRYKILLPGVKPNIYPFFKVIDTKTICYEKNISKKYAIGVWLDVFCLSYWADNIKEAQKQFKRQQFYKKMNQLIIGGNYRIMKYKRMEILAAPVRTILMALGMNSEYWCRKIIALDKYTKGEYAGDVSWPLTFEKEHYRAEWFDELIEVPFEDTVCKIVKDYDKVLTNFYGDYMTLPPENKRIRHNPEAYYIDD